MLGNGLKGVAHVAFLPSRAHHQLVLPSISQQSMSICQSCRLRLLFSSINSPLHHSIRFSTSSPALLAPRRAASKTSFSRKHVSATTTPSSIQASLSSTDLPSNMRFAAAEPQPFTSNKSSEDELLPIFAKKTAQSQAEDSEDLIPHWKVRKQALAKRLEGQRWDPSRKVSPDAQVLIRALNAEHPEQFTPNVLRKHFGISYESIRRILKSKWEPTDEQMEQRRKAWHERGKSIWAAMAVEGHKPPKKWRIEGVGRLDRERDKDGIPSWKSKEWYRRKSWWEHEVEGKALGLKKPDNLETIQDIFEETETKTDASIRRLDTHT